MLDALRGLAVIAMIAWHSADAWLRVPPSSDARLLVIVFLGGLAAPLFLLTAGAALALGAPRCGAAIGAWLAGSLRRAAMIALVGYGLNAWAWLIDRGAILELDRHGVAISAGVVLSLAASLGLASGTSLRGRFACAIGAAIAGALLASRWSELPESGRAILCRFDVLHTIGLSCAIAAAMIAGLGRRRWSSRALVLGVVALAVAGMSVSLAGMPHRVLPEPLADVLARRGPVAGASLARFPLLPWLAYVSLGAAAGCAMRGLGDARPPLLSPPRAMAASVAAAAAVWPQLPWGAWWIENVSSLLSLQLLVLNGAIALGAASVLRILCERAPHDRGAGALLRLLAALGTRSLLVYCVHLQLTYGVIALPLMGALSLWQWLASCVVLTLAMYALAESWPRTMMARPR